MESPKVIYWFMRYGSLGYEECDSVESAVGFAYGDSNNGTAVGVGIEGFGDEPVFHDEAWIDEQVAQRDREYYAAVRAQPPRQPTPWVVTITPPEPLTARGHPVLYGAYATRDEAEAEKARVGLGDRVVITHNPR
jgi:hypothetical protein